MFRFLADRIRHILVTLRVSLLSIFVTLFVTAILTLILINYHHSSSTLLASSVDLIQTVSQSLFDKLNDEFVTAEEETKFSAELIQKGLIDSTDFDKMTDYTTKLANRFNIVDRVSWSDEKGNVADASYEPDQTITSEIINRNINPPIKKYFHRDKQIKIINTILSTNLSYDTRKEFWYIKAKNAKNLIWTDIYQYHELPYLGVTVASPVYKATGELLGVFALDVRLDWISNYISQLKISEHGLIFVVTQRGKMVAFPHLYENEKFTELVDIHSLSIPWVAESFENYKKLHEQSFSFKYQGQTYLASFNSFPQSPDNYTEPWIVGVVAPENDFIAKLKLNSMIDAGIGLLILALGLCIVSALVTYAVNPIKKLVKQAEKIQGFELDEDEHIDSHIKEIFLLSNAVNGMRAGLKSFKKYVPASLVRQLIKTGEDVRVGGTKKLLTVMFSDIKDFTKLAEQVDPNQLMKTMCEYFDELSKIITEENGTIDKYIGDSIMAFWGAPLPVDNPSHRAARVALRCEKRLDELNALWKCENKSILITRFGIHIGEAIVGNVGSSERINYTAVGDAINIASRLEGINKVYGTRIMVSEPLYDIIKNDFVLRKVDRIALKGKLISHTIYELLAENKHELNFDVDAYGKYFDSGFAAYSKQDWDEAITYFEACLKLFLADTVAEVFIQRCRHFKIHRPDEWDGVWHVV